MADHELIGKRVRVKDILVFANPDDRYENIFIGKEGLVTGEDSPWFEVLFDTPILAPDVHKKDGSPWEKVGETFLIDELEVL